MRHIVYLFIWLLADAALAEQEYFTWVDASGRIHNTLVERKQERRVESPPEPAAQSAVASPLHRSNAGPASQEPGLDPDTYLTEEQFAEKRRQYEADNPPFYTYVDETGRVRTQEIVDARIEVEQPVVGQTYDHMLAPPFRVASSMAQQCCQRYRNYFKEQIPAEKAVNFQGLLNSIPLATRDGGKPAWYFVLDRQNASDFIDMTLKIRGVGSQPLALIAVNEAFQALYFIPQLSRRLLDESWLDAAYQQSDLRFEDAGVVGFIVYFPDQAAASPSMEVEWRHGKASD